MQNNQLTPEQVQQLVNAIKDPVQAYYALKDGPQYSEDQQQQLVDCIAKGNATMTWALVSISWLTADQKGQLKIVA